MRRAQVAAIGLAIAALGIGFQGGLHLEDADAVGAADSVQGDRYQAAIQTRAGGEIAMAFFLLAAAALLALVPNGAVIGGAAVALAGVASATPLVRRFTTAPPWSGVYPGMMMQIIALVATGLTLFAGSRLRLGILSSIPAMSMAALALLKVGEGLTDVLYWHDSVVSPFEETIGRQALAELLGGIGFALTAWGWWTPAEPKPGAVDIQLPPIAPAHEPSPPEPSQLSPASYAAYEPRVWMRCPKCETVHAMHRGQKDACPRCGFPRLDALPSLEPEKKKKKPGTRRPRGKKR